MSVVVNPLLFYGIRQNISTSRRRTTKMYRGSRNPQSTKPAIRQAERKQQIDHATTTSVAEISTVGYQPARSANCTDLGRKRSEYSASESHSHNGMLEHTDHCTIKRAATALLLLRKSTYRARFTKMGLAARIDRKDGQGLRIIQLIEQAARRC